MKITLITNMKEDSKNGMLKIKFDIFEIVSRNSD